jgi:hypothetical protein
MPTAANGVETHVRDGLRDWENAPAAQQAKKETQAGLVRDIFGPLPFRTVTIDPLRLAWNEGTVVRLPRPEPKGSGRSCHSRRCATRCLQKGGKPAVLVCCHAYQCDPYYCVESSLKLMFSPTGSFSTV